MAMPPRTHVCCKLSSCVFCVLCVDRFFLRGRWPPSGQRPMIGTVGGPATPDGTETMMRGSCYMHTYIKTPNKKMCVCVCIAESQNSETSSASTSSLCDRCIFRHHASIAYTVMISVRPHVRILSTSHDGEFKETHVEHVGAVGRVARDALERLGPDVQELPV